MSGRKTQYALKASSLTIALALITLGLPAQARFDYMNWQPMVGPIHDTENKLEVQLNCDYKQGFIDTNELAQLRRDLDGIQAQEDELRVDHNGLGANDIKALTNSLDRFEQNLDRAASDKFVAELAVRDPR